MSSPPRIAAGARQREPVQAREEAVEQLPEGGFVPAQDPAGHGPVDVHEVSHCLIGRPWRGRFLLREGLFRALRPMSQASRAMRN